LIIFLQSCGNSNANYLLSGGSAAYNGAVSCDVFFRYFSEEKNFPFSPNPGTHHYLSSKIYHLSFSSSSSTATPGG
jgi:hypothetical protein